MNKLYFITKIRQHWTTGAHVTWRKKNLHWCVWIEKIEIERRDRRSREQNLSIIIFFIIFSRWWGGGAKTYSLEEPQSRTGADGIPASMAQTPNKRTISAAANFMLWLLLIILDLRRHFSKVCGLHSAERDKWRRSAEANGQVNWYWMRNWNKWNTRRAHNKSKVFKWVAQAQRCHV